MRQEVKQTTIKRQRGYTRVSPKHQVTLPVEALARAGLKTGDRLRVEANGPGELVLTRSDDVLERYAGALPGVWSPGDLEELRNEWD